MRTSELAQALEQLSGLPHCLQDEGCETELPPRSAGGKGTERASGSTPVALQRPPSGRTKHNANDPTLFSPFGFLFSFSFFHFFLPLSVCALACIHNSSSSVSLSASPFPLTSAPFWLLPFTGSCPASSTEKSEENIHSCPDFTTCQLEGAWRILFQFNSDAA